MNRKILDACCGARMFWFDKSNPDVVFMDNRELDTDLCDGRKLTVRPDVLGDFREIPFPDETFRLVVFDPPHLHHVGANSWLAKKYGKLDRNTWKSDISRGFSECFRVLELGGVLVFKWSETDIPVRDVLRLAPVAPLFGQKTGKAHWLVFMKNMKENAQ